MKMNVQTAFIVSLTMIACSFARVCAEEVHDWENPEMIGRNKEPAHVTLIPYGDAQTALCGKRSASPFFKLPKVP